MELIEIYVLCKERSRALGEGFLNHFLPHREAIADDYPFPELVDEPEIVFSNVFDLMDKLDKNPNEGYSIYWNNKESKPLKQAMLFYTEDGHMIAGLVIEKHIQKDYFINLTNYVEGNYGYTSIDQAPPVFKNEFISNCKNYVGLRVVEGNILL